MQRHGLKDGPSVLLVPKPQSDTAEEFPTNWARTDENKVCASVNRKEVLMTLLSAVYFGYPRMTSPTAWKNGSVLETRSRAVWRQWQQMLGSKWRWRISKGPKFVGKIKRENKRFTRLWPPTIGKRFGALVIEYHIWSSSLVVYLLAVVTTQRKRQRGQVSRGTNFVEEEKRNQRNYGVYSGFDG